MSKSINDLITRPINPAIMIAAQFRLARNHRSRKAAAGHLEDAMRRLQNEFAQRTDASQKELLTHLYNLGVRREEIKFAAVIYGKKLAQEQHLLKHAAG